MDAIGTNSAGCMQQAFLGAILTQSGNYPILRILKFHYHFVKNSLLCLILS